MSALTALTRMPASFFGIVLGLAGLGNAWRAAHRVWGLSAIPGEILVVAAALVWAVLVVCYLAKWQVSPSEAAAELHHSVQCCFVGLIGVATLLVGIGMLPYARAVASVLFIGGAAFTLGFALWRTGLLWRGGRDAATTTPILYLPTVAGTLVTGAAAAAFGLPDWGQLFFGAGVLSWLAIESVLLHRLYTGPVLPPGLRPTLGIQLAPPAVAAVTYLAVVPEPSAMVVNALLGYAMLQALLLLRILPWIMEEPFAPSYWAFTFGATALAAAPLRLMEHGAPGATRVLALWLFLAANVVVGLVAAATLRLALQGRLLPRLPQPSAAVPTPA